MAGTQGPPDVHTRPIPSSGERLPIIGLGSWITFNVGRDVEARLACTEVIRHFFARGGRLIDSSPMYGSSQEVIGAALRALGSPRGVFAADKIWSSSPSEGPTQAEETRRRWGVTRLDLLQVHNLEAWEAHLPRLFEMKAAGAIRYVGVTTSHGRRTSETERLVRTQPLDFVQVTYNIVDRELDARLLPLARDRGIAVIVNRPFQEGALLARFARRPLPAWAREFGAASWPQFLLKFVVSHAAVTCAIPATSQPAHVIENMDAAYGPLPDATQRRRMVAWIESS
ncbi:MAG: aldo/keto reductase [Gemmatimonadetes bacterium]|nr:aldo/keto reductase [Gemmatimonadota bacterium]